MLRLIAKESPIYRHELSNKAEIPIYALTQSPKQSFLWDFQEISLGIFIARFRDTFHELFFEITLELKDSLLASDDEEQYIERILVGNFHSVDVQRLQQKVHWDEYLQGMILIQFQLKILEQLLLFCEEKHTTYLFLIFNEANQDYIEIYQRFIISKEEILSNHGEKIRISLPTDVSVYDELIDFMEEVDQSFRQTLWTEQRNNPIYREYLKSEALC